MYSRTGNYLYLLYICIVGIISLIVVFALETTVRNDIETTQLNINNIETEIGNQYNQKVQSAKDEVRYRSEDLLLKELEISEVTSLEQ